MLHSTFWNHGAGDLDLPPWALSMSSMPTDLPLRHDNTSRHAGGTSKEVTSRSSAPPEGLFLDFLYPPQALAWLQRTPVPHWERWERRNARRLPEGFVQTSRGYASRARAQVEPSQSDKGQEQGYRRGSATKRMGLRDDKADSVMEELSASGDDAAKEIFAPDFERRAPDDVGASTEDISPTTEFANSPGDLAELEGTLGLGQSTSHGTAESAEDNVSGAEFADTPGALAEAGTDTMQRLRDIMISSRESLKRVGVEKQQALSTRVLKIYDSLHRSDKDDVRLKIELLEFLSVCPNNDAEVRCLELYQSIPVDERTLQVYQAALTVLLRRGRHVQAINLHREALQRIANGDQVTKTFFKYAVDQHRWPLAMNIEAQYENAVLKYGVRGGMFWFQVSQIPELLPKALAMARYLRALNHARTSNDQVRQFAAKFFREALFQEIEATEPAKTKTSTSPQGGLGMPKASVGSLFHYLGQLDDAAKLYERLLMSMVGPSSRYQYPQIHRIVSYVYGELRRRRKAWHHRMSQGLLMTMLERLTRFWDMLETQREQSHSVTVNNVVEDWKRDYGKLSQGAVAHLLSWHARSGRLDQFHVWYAYFEEHYPGYEAWRGLLWATIYVHARRANLVKAKEAFEEAVKVTAEHDEIPPLPCWNVLLHAHSRADDLEGALDTLQALIDRGLRPDEYSFHPVMEMAAKRGDVEGVKDLMSQYDDLAQKKREAAFTGSLLTALVNSGEVNEAEAVLKNAIDEVKTGKIRGSLTGSFNIVLTAHALRRNVDATMRTYRWMKAAEIRMDADTFAALIQALTVYRQSHAAYKILRTVMPEHGVRPTAFHYALVMTGYVNQGKYADALGVYDHMQTRKIRHTFSSNTIYLKAKALKEHADSKRAAFRKVQPEPLDDTIKELQRILQASHGNDLAAKQSQTGLGVEEYSPAVTAAYFNFLIYIHGKRRCFEAVQELYEKFKAHPKNLGDTDAKAPIEMLSALMAAHLRAGDFEEVERCWLLAKQQADEVAAVVPVPQLKVAADEEEEPESDLMKLRPPDDAQEAGFQISTQPTGNGKVPQPPPQAKQALVVASTTGPKAPKPIPGRHYVLTRPLRFYLYALARQSRFHDILSVVSRLFGQGYTMDNRTWNAFLQLLCQCSPPLVLLSFTLTERFLIPHFPGWAPIKKAYIPNQSARKEGLQYIRARYLRPGQLMPQYRTLVMLGSALLQLRTIEATGRRGRQRQDSVKGTERYVGSMKQIRKQAPRTLFAVQSMPNIDDALQNRLLKRA